MRCFALQVLVGLRDNHDELVAASLHALAEMVPVLGSEAVVGPNRHPVFKEGKPKVRWRRGLNHSDSSRSEKEKLEVAEMSL